MRIRKRKVPLPLSLLSPVSLSDPHLFGRSPVIVQQHDLTTTSQPSDHTSSNTSASDLRRWIENNDPTTTPRVEYLKPCLGFEENERKEGIIDARNVLALSNTRSAKSREHNTIVSISCEEKQIPVKKRSRGSTLATTLEAEVEEEREDKNAHEGGKKGGGGGGSKVRRGTTIMEGSRCSRVNGRGWRCCQPTLVGYSLCEHHLGKGRLRSMTSVRGRPSKAAVVAEPRLRPLPSEAAKGNDECGTTDETHVMVNSSVGKRVKARSLSSLLGQRPSGSSNANDCQDQVKMNVINGEIDVNDGNQMVNEGV